jgi:hypothetical protein
MTPPDVSEVVPYFTSAATIVFVQKALKQTQLYARFIQAFPGADKYAHWFVAGLGSLIAAEGIHITYGWTVATGGTISFAVPGLAALLHGFSDWFKVYILQHTIYSSTHEPPYQPPPPKGLA